MRRAGEKHSAGAERVWPAIVETIVGFLLFVASGMAWVFSFALAGSDSALGDPGVWLQLAVLLVPVVLGVVLFAHGGRKVVRRGL
jgi:UPF0716 family protein affecting phage T7 exclusion